MNNFFTFYLKNYIIFETKIGGDLVQKDSIITQFYERIKEQWHEEVYIVSDFLNLGEYHTVRKAIIRLEELGKIMRGVYYYPRYSALI